MHLSTKAGDLQRCGRCKRMLPSGEFAPWCHECRRREWQPVAYDARPCAFCGTDFVPTQANMVYCKRKCKVAAANAVKSQKLLAGKPQRVCANPDCGMDITHRRSDTIWCSDRCRSKSLSPELRRKYRLSSKYGITPEQYDQMAADQGDRCWICRTDDPKTPHGFWHIDHCHTTGILRGLLCHGCNIGIGNFYDNPECLIRAAEYIESFRAVSQCA